MGIHRPIAVGVGYGGVTVNDGGVGALIGGDGEVYSAFFEGATQSHPLQIMGGQRLSLGSAGLQEDPVLGWNVLTGAAAISQSATGIDATLDVTNPEALIDLPVFGAIVPNQIILEMDISGATPGNGNFVGLRFDNNLVSVTVEMRVESNGSVWHASVANNGVPSLSAQAGVAFGSVGTVKNVIASMAMASTSHTQRNSTCEMGVTQLAPLDNKTLSQNAPWEDLTIPSTWDLAIHAQWVSGSPLVVKLKSIAVISGGLAMTTVD